MTSQVYTQTLSLSAPYCQPPFSSTSPRPLPCTLPAASSLTCILPRHSSKLCTLGAPTIHNTLSVLCNSISARGHQRFEGQSCKEYNRTRIECMLLHSLMLQHKQEACSHTGLTGRRSPAARQVAGVQQVAIGQQDRVGLLGCLDARCVPEPARNSDSCHAIHTLLGHHGQVSTCRAPTSRKGSAQTGQLATPGCPALNKYCHT